MFRLKGACALSIVTLASSVASAAFSTTSVVADYYSYGGGATNNGRYILNNGYQNGAEGFEAISFLKFDLSGVSLAAGEKAYFTVTKYGIPSLYNSSDANPVLIGVSPLSTNDVATSDNPTGIAAMKAEISPNPQPALTATAAEGWVGSNRTYSWDVTALVEQWLSDPSSNLGFALHARNDFNLTTPTTLENPYFVSSDGPDAAHVASGYVAADALTPTLSSSIPVGSTLVAVPEPASLTALALGGLALRRQRRAR